MNPRPIARAARRAGRRRAGGQRGAAIIELVIFLPVLVVLAIGAAFTARVVLDYNHLNQLSQTGARYASRAALDPTRPTVYRFRPTTVEVEEYVRDIAELPLTAVEVSPDPSTLYPGDEVTVTVRSHRDLGVVGDAANALAGLVGAQPPFPNGGVDLTSTASMREE